VVCVCSGTDRRQDNNRNQMFEDILAGELYQQYYFELKGMELATIK
jgi:hypothetical protein